MAEIPLAELDSVRALVELVQERFQDGPTNREWLLDHNLPDLYVAIHGLYAALGESERLSQAIAAQQ
jgi:hypothetical protein